jgi:hypothetical protein
MTCFDPAPTQSAFDLPIELAATRPATLRDERTQARLAAVASGTDPDVTGSPTLTQLRRAVGRRLVALGSAIDPAPSAGISTPRA